jgi:hypothetical protein
MTTTPNPITAIPGAVVPGATPGTTPPILPGGGTSDPSSQVSEMTKRLLATLAQASQRKQFAGTPVPGAIPGQQDMNAARSIGMNTANPRGWGLQRFSAGISASIQNAVSAEKQKKLNKAEADWTYLQSALNEKYQAEASKDPKAIAAAQQKIDVVMTDPKKLKDMAKALNQDWLNPEKTTVYGEALKKVSAKTKQTETQQQQQDQQKQQAAQGLKGMFQKLMQQRQQPQLSPEQQKAMGAEIEAKAPTTTAGWDPKAIEAQEKILHDRANEALAAGRDATSAALKKSAQALQEARIAQDKENKKADQDRKDKELELKQKAEDERIRHDKAVEAAQRAAAGGGGEGGAKDIVDAIKNGDQPPTTQGLYKLGAAVRAEAARQHVPLARMEQDWKATEKYMSTLNGPQQTRLRQDISTVSDSLDKVEGLYDEWSKLAKTSGYKVLNHATLKAMEAMPGRAGAVAQALEAQIADTTAGLGTIYMGGNSPTDHSLELAAHSLSADWNDETMKEAMKQAHANVKIRENSITHSRPAGVSADSPYMPKDSAAPPAAKEKDPLGIF